MATVMVQAAAADMHHHVKEVATAVLGLLGTGLLVEVAQAAAETTLLMVWVVLVVEVSVQFSIFVPQVVVQVDTVAAVVAEHARVLVDLCPHLAVQETYCCVI